MMKSARKSASSSAILSIPSWTAPIKLSIHGLNKNKSAVKLWANSPEIRAATRELLALQKTSKSLLNSDVQNRLRIWFKPLKEVTGYQGYFIIAPNNINLASSRDQNIGHKTPLLNQPKILQRIWQGEAIVSLPQRAHIPLADGQGALHENQPTLFIGAPILNDAGQSIAIFIFRLNPSDDFTAIFQQGGMGESGKTYAFDSQARLISNSRFDQHLRDAGLITKDQRGMLNLEIRDPGVDLTVQQTSPYPRREHPLTRMAAAAVQGQSGIDLDGYRDYRGVPVVGAWKWDPELGFGIATEQNIDEAYTTIKATRKILFIFSLLLILLSLATLRIYSLQQRRQQAEYKFRALLESAPDAMVIVNNKGIITLINEQTEKLFQYPREELLDQTVEMLIPEQYVGEHVNHRNHYISQPKTRRMGAQKDLYGKKKDGTHVPLEISLNHLESDEGMLIASAIRDISDRKEAEAELKENREHLQELVTQRTAALEASNKELESYSHSIAHDLRQPLRSITSFSQILLEDANDKLNAEEKDNLNRIATAGKKMSRLIEDILELSRITRCELHPVSLDLSDLSRRILSLLEASQPERVVLTQVQEGISASCDPKLIEIALQQLFGNAWKFTRDTQTPKIIFGCRTIDDKPTYYVQDNGMGFDMKYGDTLFKPFHHPHSGSEAEVMGIGLAMAQRAIQRHGGRIWAESELGQGMTIFFTLG